MKQTTFKEEGYKRIKCQNCDRYLAESHLGEKKLRIAPCKKCKSVTLIFPPRKGRNEKGEKVIFWGSGGGQWTADHTMTKEDEKFLKYELTDDESRQLKDWIFPTVDKQRDQE